MGGRGSIDRNFREALLKNGFIVVSVDYRLAPETKLPEILTDVQDAYRWVREKGPTLFQADPAKIGVAGGSAGGYLTLTTGYKAEPRPRALVSFWGYGDISSKWYSKPDPFYSRQPPVSKDEAYRAVGGPVLSESSGRNNRSRLLPVLPAAGPLAKGSDRPRSRCRAGCFRPVVPRPQCYGSIPTDIADSRHQGHRRAIRPIRDDGQGTQIQGR